jgi:fructosamine-3-kinase
MPLHDSDISWQVLRRIVQQWAGTAAELAEVRPLDGGNISNVLGITTQGGEHCVLKISPHRVSREFERETYQLQLLRKLGIPAPQVYATHIADLDDPTSYILMEFVEGVDLAEAKRQCSPDQFDHLQQQLADIVAAMHAHTGEKYMRVMQPEGESFPNWPAFFRTVYDPIWHEAEKHPSLPGKARKQIAKIHEKLDRLLAHGDRPRLVHWDIWSTNLLAAPDEDGNWRITALLDPNCKFAHAEAEIAYMELFHTVTPAFLKAYGKHHKLGDDYHRVRKNVYQLYPMIDHLQLFGEQYLKPLLAALERCAAVT